MILIVCSMGIMAILTFNVPLARAPAADNLLLRFACLMHTRL
jgi:hypothetical protein